jgi:hypothetical protein
VDEVIGRGGGEERVVARDLAGGIDSLDALSKDIDFGPAIFALQRGKLAVGVGDADVVQIDERELADAGAGQRLDDP